MSVLVEGGVRQTLFRMAFPMLAGRFAMNAYSLTDAWFVSRLGTAPLAAMSFIFPVIMVLTCVAGGLGTGVTALVSRAIGRHDRQDAAKLVTHGITLTLAITFLVAVAGYFSNDPPAMLSDGRLMYTRFWATGYCVSTVGLDEETIRKYVREQEKLDSGQEALGFEGA